MYEYKNKNGVKYYLHTMEVILRGGNRKQRIYYFAREINSDRATTLPQGYKVVENTRTGLPVLKKV